MNSSVNGLNSLSQAVWCVIFENVGIRTPDGSSKCPQSFTIESQMFGFDVL
jgi:hypothetical protein